MKVSSDKLLLIIGKKDVELFHLESQLVILAMENKTLKEELKELKDNGNRSDT